jgi:hypothetical protein
MFNNCFQLNQQLAKFNILNCFKSSADTKSIDENDVKFQPNIDELPKIQVCEESDVKVEALQDLKAQADKEFKTEQPVQESNSLTQVVNETAPNVDDDININALMPKFVDNMRKHNEEVILTGDQQDEDNVKFYCDEIILDQLNQTIDEPQDDNRKVLKIPKNSEYLSLPDYLHQKLLMDMMYDDKKQKKKKKLSKYGPANLVQHFKSFNEPYGDDEDDDLQDRYESTLFYRYGLASRLVKKPDSKSDQSKKFKKKG